jgi:hypothetical protein
MIARAALTRAAGRIGGARLEAGVFYRVSVSTMAVVGEFDSPGRLDGPMEVKWSSASRVRRSVRSVCLTRCAEEMILTPEPNRRFQVVLNPRC